MIKNPAFSLGTPRTHNHWVRKGSRREGKGAPGVLRSTSAEPGATRFYRVEKT